MLGTIHAGMCVATSSAQWRLIAISCSFLELRQQSLLISLPKYTGAYTKLLFTFLIHLVSPVLTEDSSPIFTHRQSDLFFQDLQPLLSLSSNSYSQYPKTSIFSSILFCFVGKPLQGLLVFSLYLATFPRVEVMVYIHRYQMLEYMFGKLINIYLSPFSTLFLPLKLS